MRAWPLLLVVACSVHPKPAPVPLPNYDRSPTLGVATTNALGTQARRASGATEETLAEDSPRTTLAGNTFIAPAGWTLRVRAGGTILEVPEGDSFIALYDLTGIPDGDGAIAKAWSLYAGEQTYSLLEDVIAADRDGWTRITSYQYDVPPKLKRMVGAQVRFANGVWTAILYDMDDAIAEKRGAQLKVLLDRLLPKGGSRESFAGKRAHSLDAARIAKLRAFVDTARRVSRVPGIAFGVVERGKVVFSGGVGLRRLDKPAKVDAHTKFMIASNTKALTTLLLAKLVDEGKITWESKATDILPSFKLGTADATRKIRIKHLVCACTGLPRQDLESLFEWADSTPASVIEMLSTMQPTSEFGELFQYSNTLAAAAGYIGGHALFPELEFGSAFDRAMQYEVFDPLEMKATTFDFARGARGNAAAPHAPDIDGKPALTLAELNTSLIPARPAGAAWSTVHDMLKYIQMELDEGVVGERPYIGREALLERRAPQVAVGADATYGMGLMVDTTWGVTVVHHGGDVVGFHSGMLWLPEYDVGAAILTNGDPGWLIRSEFQRKLLEVLFDGNDEAEARLTSRAHTFFDLQAAQRKRLSVPADLDASAKLAPTYVHPALGTINVRRDKAATFFDFGEYESEVASRKNSDGSISFITIETGFLRLEFVVGDRDGKPTLTIRDRQHEYEFTPI